MRREHSGQHPRRLDCGAVITPLRHGSREYWSSTETQSKDTKKSNLNEFFNKESLTFMLSSHF